MARISWLEIGAVHIPVDGLSLVGREGLDGAECVFGEIRGRFRLSTTPKPVLDTLIRGGFEAHAYLQLDTRKRLECDGVFSVTEIEVIMNPSEDVASYIAQIESIGGVAMYINRDKRA